MVFQTQGGLENLMCVWRFRIFVRLQRFSRFPKCCGLIKNKFIHYINHTEWEVRAQQPYFIQWRVYAQTSVMFRENKKKRLKFFGICFPAGGVLFEHKSHTYWRLTFVRLLGLSRFPVSFSRIPDGIMMVKYEFFRNFSNDDAKCGWYAHGK